MKMEIVETEITDDEICVVHRLTLEIYEIMLSFFGGVNQTLYLRESAIKTQNGGKTYNGWIKGDNDPNFIRFLNGFGWTFERLYMEPGFIVNLLKVVLSNPR